MDQDPAVPQPAGEKATENKEEHPNVAWQRSGWCGRYDAETEEWYCRCDRLAKLLPTRKGRHQGRSVYSCPIREPKKEDDLQRCQFFLWQDEQEEAKKWMEKNPTTPRKQPTKPREIRTPKSPNNGSSKKMNEWLQLGSKRPIKDISDGDGSEEKEEGKESDEDFVVVGNDEDRNIFGEENLYDSSPSRKAAKVARFATPGQPLNDGVEDNRNVLPTPVTGGSDGNRTFKGRDVSPIPIRLEAAINLDDDSEPLPPGKVDLINKILAVIKTDYPDLKVSTSEVIRHEIEEEACKLQAEVKVCRRTIARLRKMVDVLEETERRLEKFIVDISGGSFADDPVVLSDGEEA